MSGERVICGVCGKQEIVLSVFIICARCECAWIAWEYEAACDGAASERAIERWAEEAALASVGDA